MDHTFFQDIVQSKVISFSMVQEMGNGRSMTLACLDKINGLFSVATEENRNDNGH